MTATKVKMPSAWTPFFKVMAVFFLIIILLILTDRCFFQKSFGTQARIQTVRQDFTKLHIRLYDYHEEGEVYPSSTQGLHALVEKPTTDPLPNKWVQTLSELPLDPWESPYRYQFPGTKNPNEPEIICAGPDRWFGTKDDLSSQE